MIATFYDFDKRKNSTARPAGSGTDITVNLKEGTDLDNPVFIMETNVLGYSYMKWNDHYYFIVGRRYLHHSLFEITCEIDVLASYRASIKSSTQYVLRTSAGADDYIYDDLYPLKVNPTVTVHPESAGFNFSSPTYLVTTKGKNGSVVYAMSKYYFDTIAAAMYNISQDDLWQSLTSSAMWYKSFVDAFSFITDARIIPIAQSSISGSSTATFDLGFWSYTDPDGTAAFKIVSNTIYNASTIHMPIPAPPSGHKAFLASNKSRSLELFLPGVGLQTLDAEKLKTASEVRIDWLLDKKGIIAYAIDAGNEVHYCSADISMPVAIYSNISNAGGAIAGAAKVVGGAVAGAIAGNVPGAVIGAITGGISGIAGASPIITSQSLGVDGSWAALASQPNIILTTTQYDIPAQAPALFGYPYCATMTLSTNGYYLIKDPQVSFGDDVYIKDKISEFMASGFYIE